MNPSTLIGILGSFAMLGSVFYWSADDPSLFVNLPGLAIVLGGTLAATFIAFPLKEVLRVSKLFWTVLKSEKLDAEKDIEELVKVSTLWIQNKLNETEVHAAQINNPFIRSGIELILVFTPHEDIMEFMSWRISRMEAKENAEAQLFRVMAGFAPAFGMVGTLVGLINMMFMLGDGDMTAIGQQLAIALMTTFYGVLLSNLLFKPVAVKLERRTEQRVVIMNMIMQGVSMMSRKQSPRLMEETLNSFIASYDNEIFDGDVKPKIDAEKSNGKVKIKDQVENEQAS